MSTNFIAIAWMDFRTSMGRENSHCRFTKGREKDSKASIDRITPSPADMERLLDIKVRYRQLQSKDLVMSPIRPQVIQGEWFSSLLPPALCCRLPLVKKVSAKWRQSGSMLANGIAHSIEQRKRGNMARAFLYFWASRYP